MAILLVEDDRELRSVLQMALQDEGLEVQVAADGSEAVARFSDWRPSLVVLDWMLPDMDGKAVAGHLRKRHGNEVPIVLLTADGRAQAKGAEIGAFSVFSKPFDLEEVLEAVRRGITDP